MTSEFTKQSTLFVTGGTGFIGSHFVNEALRRGHRVVALRRTGSRPRIKLEHEPEWVDGVLGDGNHSDAFSGCDVFVHLAAAGVVPPDDSWENCFRWNVDASLREWIHAADAGIKRFVICGSCFEYGRAGERYDFIPVDAPLEPTGPYHASKAAATMAATALSVQRGLETVIVRPFHVYGEGEQQGRLWPMLKAAAITGRDIDLTEGMQIRDFISVDAVALKFIELIEQDSNHPGIPEIINIGAGIPKTIRQFAEEVWRKYDAKGHLNFGKLPYRNQEVMRYVPLIK